MAKVTINDNFPISGGRLWQITGAFDALSESCWPEEGSSEVTRSENFGTHRTPEADIGKAIEGGFQFGFENLNELFDR